MKARLTFFIVFIALLMPYVAFAGWGDIIRTAETAIEVGQLLDMTDIGDEEEKEIGRSVHKEISRDYEIITEGGYYDLLQKIGADLVESNELDDYDYKFYLVKSSAINAFAAPGGFIYVFTGLMDVMAYDPSMLAGVVAHEIGHVHDKHTRNRLEKAARGELGFKILDAATGSEYDIWAGLLYKGGELVYLKYNRDQEEFADRFGVEFAYHAGYDPYGIHRGMLTLMELSGSSDDFSEYFAQHPSTDKRARRTYKIALENSEMHHGEYMEIPEPPVGHVLSSHYANWQEGIQSVDVDDLEVSYDDHDPVKDDEDAAEDEDDEDEDDEDDWDY